MMIIHCVKSPVKILDRMVNKGLLNWLPDELYLKMLFRLRLGYSLNLANPKTFNEKIQWLKLYDRRPEYKEYVDKYAVRDHIRKVVGEEYLIPLLGVWDSVEDIDFSLLPDQFVLKTTHDSGGVAICRDKSVFDISAAKQKLNRHMKNDFFMYGREWAYKGVPRRIVAETYLEDRNGSLNDYKIFCFGGHPRFIQVDFDRFTDHKRNLYSPEWEYLPFTIQYPTHPEISIPRPPHLDEMLRIASSLSSGLKHVRVDLYSIGGRIYFGEMTLYHGCGFEEFDPQQWDYIIGSWLVLPKRFHK